MDVPFRVSVSPDSDMCNPKSVPPMCPFLVIRTRKLTKTHPACLFLQIRTCGVVLRVCVCLFLPNRTHLRQIFSTFVRFFTILSKAKGLESLDSSPFRLVRAGGVEPPRAYTHCHLKTARLPFRHARRQSTNLHQNLCNLKSAWRAAIFRRKIQAARREEGGSPVGFRTTEPSLNFAIFRRKIQAARRSVCPILAFRTSSECF